MSAIAVFRTAVLALLDDPTNVRYTSAQVDQGLRQALQEYSLANPRAALYNVDGNGNYRFELPADFQPIQITGVELHDATANPQCPILFYAYNQDSQWIMETKDTLVKVGQSIDISYGAYHTIDGLDSGAGTTIPAEDEAALEMGAAGFAAIMRAVSRSESVNLQPDVTKALLDLSVAFLEAFHASIYHVRMAAFAEMPGLDGDVF